jgi:actin-related protein
MLSFADGSSIESKSKSRKNEFETFQVGSFYVAIQDVMPLYSSGRKTGIIVDAGDTVPYSVPIHEGRTFPHAVMSVDLGGRDITAWLLKILNERGHTFRRYSEHQIARHIKETLGYVALDFEVEFANCNNSGLQPKLWHV